MLDMNDIAQGLLIAFLGFALIRIGTYLVRLYERWMRSDPRKVMSWDVFATLAVGPYAPAFTLGVLCIYGGVMAMIVGGLFLIFSLFPLLM
jgi:hypothetical protein